MKTIFYSASDSSGVRFAFDLSDPWMDGFHVESAAHLLTNELHLNQSR